MPTCMQYVVVASDKYFGNQRGEVNVNASDIAPFIKSLCELTSGGNKKFKIERVAMLQWLDKALPNYGKPNYLLLSFVEVADLYLITLRFRQST